MIDANARHQPDLTFLSYFRVSVDCYGSGTVTAMSLVEDADRTGCSGGAAQDNYTWTN